MKPSEVAELLDLREEELAALLGAVGWEDHAEFSDYEQATLEGTVKNATAHNSDYLTGYFRYVAEGQKISEDIFNDIGAAIGESNQAPVAFRGDFLGICKRVAGGMNPKDALTPPVVTESDKELADVCAELGLGAGLKESIDPLIDEAADVLAGQFVALVADLKNAVVEVSEDMHMDLADVLRRKVLARLNIPEMKAEIAQSVLGGARLKKRLPEKTATPSLPPSTD